MLTTPPTWRVVDFISDLHLQPGEPLTFLAWQTYMQNTQADAVFILGDLFEVWVGDDVLNDTSAFGRSYEAQCAEVLREASTRLRLFFLHGNRDFLIGQQFAKACNIEILPDPCVLDLQGTRWVLSHGDALCLADRDYQQFRNTVRTADWQASFLGRPLTERRSIARALREQSQARKQAASDYADVDAHATKELLKLAGTNHLIHGHTHRPADHFIQPGLHRHVLSDWDLSATPVRAEVFRLSVATDSTIAVSRLDPSEV